ncbi:DNA-binding response regulator [Aliidiomarina shirensis]|uniref:DNA-binding response regulator n=2 Tax=Bacteria TaxID=2 RepID=A0A432WT98_9GAMM|nr:response regulator transcription factor [Aliidiomarina shirensis]RUO36968.1 DNA-binding response regulator [Aliidiomarina shirensis]
MSSDKNKIRIVIADDHTLVRQSIVQMLRQQGDFEVVQECEDGVSLVQAAIQKAPDVILMDISMPKMNGLVAIDKLLDNRPDAKVLVLTMHDEIEYMHALHTSGARGYVLKESSTEQLSEAIRVIHEGGTFFPNALTQSLASGKGSSTDDTSILNNLTRREREVFHLVVAGRATKEIAVLLDMSYKTAENHRGRILNKLQVSNTAELIRLAARKGLLE